jgi:hypothetical protein
VHWSAIPGWFDWRSAQYEAVDHFPSGSQFVEVGSYLGRSLCSLADVVRERDKAITIVGIDTCLGSGVEGPRQKDYHAGAVAEGGGTFAGLLHANILACGHGDRVSVIIAPSTIAAGFFADSSIAWVHLDARHDYAQVAADIAAWQPKLARGGWLSGDDYDREKWPDVVRAVTDSLPGARPWSNGQWRWDAE